MYAGCYSEFELRVFIKNNRKKESVNNHIKKNSSTISEGFGAYCEACLVRLAAFHSIRNSLSEFTVVEMKNAAFYIAKDSKLISSIAFFHGAWGQANPPESATCLRVGCLESEETDGGGGGCLLINRSTFDIHHTSSSAFLPLQSYARTEPPPKIYTFSLLNLSTPFNLNVACVTDDRVKYHL